MEILLPPVLLHDLVVYPKGSDKSSKSSDESADLAEKNILQRYNYPQDKINQICDCILTHSYSKRLIPRSLEGKILQDADRLDAFGAIGIARAFSIGGSENRKFYNVDEPFYRSDWDLDDMQWTLDHFQTKLLKLEDSMRTKTAKKIARAYKIHDTVHPTIAKGNLAVVYIVFVALFYILVLACKHLCNFFF
jgi:uncharacterized protein